MCLTVHLFIYLHADSSLLHGGSLGMASVNDTISCSSLTFAASYSCQAGTESELFSQMPTYHSDNNTLSSSNRIISCVVTAPRVIFSVIQPHSSMPSNSTALNCAPQSCSQLCEFPSVPHTCMYSLPLTLQGP